MINLQLTNDEIVTVLLTTYLALEDKQYKPFTLIEWNTLVNTIINSPIKEPGKLLELEKSDIKEILGLSDNISDRMNFLLGRGALLAIELESLNNKGIGIITRSNPNYPRQLKKKLRVMAPPVLFYCGNLELANKKGVAIVGSRNVEDEMVEHTVNIARAAIEQGYIIYSGGAKGVDSISENEAFNQGGEYVSFLADSLGAKIKKKDVRERLMTNRILLLSALKPDVGFSVGSAMNRNKYVYSMSDCTFIINSDYNKGGTWAGAIENLKNGWVKSIVIDSKSKGNQALKGKGIVSIKETAGINIEEVIEGNNKNTISEIIQIDLFH